MNTAAPPTALHAGALPLRRAWLRLLVVVVLLILIAGVPRVLRSNSNAPVPAATSARTASDATTSRATQAAASGAAEPSGASQGRER